MLLHWEHEVLTPGPLGKSQHILSIYTGHVFVHFPIYEEVGDSRVRYLCFFFLLRCFKEVSGGVENDLTWSQSACSFHVPSGCPDAGRWLLGRQTLPSCPPRRAFRWWRPPSQGPQGKGRVWGSFFTSACMHILGESVLCLAQDILLFSESSNTVMFCSAAILFI